MRGKYRAFRTTGNELVQSFIFGDEADARVIQAQAEIATRIDGAKTLTSYPSLIKGDIQERSTEAAYVTKSEEVKTKAPKQSSRRIPLRNPRKWP